VRHGLNPSFHGPSSRAIVFGDAFLRARDIDPAGTRIFSGVSVPPGLWTLRWSGSGASHLAGLLRERERGPGFALYDVERAARPVHVSWTGDVNSLRVWLPGSEGLILWRPFVALLKSFKPAAIRTLDWTRVNEGFQPGRDKRSQYVVSASAQVLIANQVGCGLHYQVPLGAPEDWIAEHLRPLRNVNGRLTIECGNELWNPDFSGWWWLEQHKDGGRVSHAAAKELDRIFAVVRAVLPRAEFFVGGQLGNEGFLESILDTMQTAVQACGPAAYLRPRSEFLTAQGFVESCRAELLPVAGRIREARRLATARGLRLEVYEAGQHPTSGTPIVAEAQRLVAMGTLYRDLAGVLEEEGVDLVHWYSLMTQYDDGIPPFGLLESMDTSTPKADVVRELSLASTP